MRNALYILFGIFIFFISGTVCPAEEAAVDININVQEFQLENGMLFLVVERHTTPQVAVRLAIRAGSALEETGKTGIAHLLEHMMFKGTKNFGTLDPEKDAALQKKIDAAYQTVQVEQQKRNPDQKIIDEKLNEMESLRSEVQKIYVSQAFSSQLGQNGAVGINAFTTKDQTQYISAVPSDMIEQWFSIISEQLFEPSWREFFVEKEVVQREWAFRYINDPGGAAWLDLSTTAYSAHPYRNPVIGWKSDMENYSTRDAIDFHQKYYNPSNAVCVLVGDISVAQVRKLAETYFKRYPAGKPAPATVTREPVQAGPRRNIRFLKGARTPLVRIGFHSADMGSRDFFALDAMTMVLSHGRGARMTHNIVNKGQAVSAWAYNPDNRYGSMIILGGSPNEPEGLRAADITDKEKREAYIRASEGLEQRLLDEVDKFKTELVSARELQRIIKLNQRDFLDRMSSNEDMAGTLATLEVQIGWRYLTGYLERIAEITPEDIQRAARKYLTAENQTTVFVIPGGKPNRPPEAYREVRSASGSGTGKTARHGLLKNVSIYPTPHDWKHPLSFERKPEKIIYPQAQNFTIGDTAVFYLQDDELPLINLTLLVKAGAVDLDDAQIGLTNILEGALIAGGTERYSPGELAMVLDENGIQIGVSIDLEQTSIHLSVLKNDWRKGLDLLREILTQPRFDSEVLTAVKSQNLVGLKRQGGDAQSVAVRESMIWHFKGHPYGRDPLQGLKTIPDISDADLKQFLKTYLVPANITAAVSGDVSRQEVIDGLSDFLKGLPETKAPERTLDDPNETPPVLALIHKPGQVQSQVILTLPSVKRVHPSFWKTSLLMNIFGGSDSLMYKRLRDDLGLVYSAGFYQTYKWNAGLLLGYIGCKADKTGDAVMETIRIMEKLRKDIPEKDLEQKRLDALNSFVFNVDTTSDLVAVYGRYHMRSEPLDTLDRIQDAYISATREDLRDIADNMLDSRKMQIFVVADKNTPVRRSDGQEETLENNLKGIADGLGLPFKEIELR